MMAEDKRKLTILMSLMVIMLRTNRLIRTIAGPSGVGGGGLVVVVVLW